MAGLLAYAAAGLAEGAGNGMVEDAKAKREAAREKLRMEFQTSERVAGQEFRTEERKDTETFTDAQRRKGEDFTGGQNKASRGLTASEGAASRASAAALQNARLSAERRRQLETDQQYKSFETRDNGVLVGIRSDGTAVEITDKQGEPVKPRVSTKDTNPVTDRKNSDETARLRAEDVVGPAPDQDALLYDPAMLEAYNKEFLSELNRQREAMGLSPLTSVPEGKPLPKAAETPVADRVDGQEYEHNGKTYIWRQKDGKWEPK